MDSELKRQEYLRVRYHEAKAAGLCTQCFTAAAKDDRVYCEACSDRMKERYRGNPERRIDVMLKGCKQRSLKRGMDCTITREWIAERLKPGVCEVTGIRFELGAFLGSRLNPYSPSVDRIDSTGPYSPDNCRLILWGLNAALAQWGEGPYLDIAMAYISKGNHVPRV